MPRKSKRLLSQTPPSIPPTPPRPPKTKIITKNYELHYKIGRGGFSEVYYSKSKSPSPKTYAIKVNYSTVSLQRSYQQLKCLMKVDGHRYFPKLIDAFMEANHVYIVQEYCSSWGFQDLVRYGNMDDVRFYLFQLLNALKVLKDNGIFHCDVKPGNFLYDGEKKRGVLIDFGLAKEVENQKERPKIFLKNSTAGTRQYTPLQLFFNLPYSFASQIWSVGVIMLQLITRKQTIFDSCLNLLEDYDYLVTFMLELALLDKQKLIEQVHNWGYELLLPQDLSSISLSQITKVQGYNQTTENLLQRMLDINPLTRITVEQAINHEFFSAINPKSPSRPRAKRRYRKDKID